MTISSENVTVKNVAGRVANLQPYFHTVEFPGDAAYPDGGTPGIKAILQAAIGLKIKPVAVQTVNCGAYLPEITETPATIQTAAPSWPVADQDGNTIVYKLNGADEATLTLSGIHTSRASLAASLDAITGVRAYDDGVQVTFKTDKVGEDASFEIVSGTALTAYGLSAGDNVGSAEQLLRINNVADGTDAGAKTASTDLSGTTFKVLVISE
jgi:hypothetical protein